MDNFDLRKYLAEGRILKEELSDQAKKNPKIDLDDLDLDDLDLDFGDDGLEIDLGEDPEDIDAEFKKLFPDLDL